jgi:hypothetical protein
MIAEAWKILRACGIRRHHLGHSTGHQIPFVKFYRHRMSVSVARSTPLFFEGVV